MDDDVNPFLSPLTPGFATGRFVGVCGGLYRQYFPSWWGIVIFRNANPDLPPPQLVPGVVTRGPQLLEISYSLIEIFVEISNLS